MKGILTFVEQFGDMRFVAFGMALEYLSCRDGHGRIQKNLGRTRQSSLRHTFVQIKENILGALQGEGGNDDIAAALEGIRDGCVHFLDGRLHLFMQAVAVGCLHYHHVGF